MRASDLLPGFLGWIAPRSPLLAAPSAVPQRVGWFSLRPGVSSSDSCSWSQQDFRAGWLCWVCRALVSWSSVSSKHILKS